MAHLAVYLGEWVTANLGFGTVFLCDDRVFRRDVAVKSLHADDLDRRAEEIFAEAHALNELSHPAVIKIISAGYADPVNGRELSGLLAIPPLDVRVAVRQGTPT